MGAVSDMMWAGPIQVSVRTPTSRSVRPDSGYDWRCCAVRSRSRSGTVIAKSGFISALTTKRPGGESPGRFVYVRAMSAEGIAEFAESIALVVEVDGHPAEPEQLPAPQPKAERQDVQGRQPVLVGGLEDQARLRHGQAAVDLVLGHRAAPAIFRCST